MQIVIVLAIVILPTAAVLWGIVQGLADYPEPDNSGILEMNENGIYELRIL